MVISANANQVVCKEVRATQRFWNRATKWRSHFGSTTDSDTAKALINFAISELERQQNPSQQPCEIHSAPTPILTQHGSDNNGKTE